MTNPKVRNTEQKTVYLQKSIPLTKETKKWIVEEYSKIGGGAIELDPTQQKRP